MAIIRHGFCLYDSISVSANTCRRPRILGVNVSEFLDTTVILYIVVFRILTYNILIDMLLDQRTDFYIKWLIGKNSNLLRLRF